MRRKAKREVVKKNSNVKLERIITEKLIKRKSARERNLRKKKCRELLKTGNKEHDKRKRNI